MELGHTILRVRLRRVFQVHKLPIIGQGERIHWPALDEDVSVENLLSGKVSGESQRSLQQRIEQRLGSTPMPQICEFFGVGSYMYYNDHRPPHFHALYAEHEALLAI
jgi:hypothetical protein